MEMMTKEKKEFDIQQLTDVDPREVVALADDTPDGGRVGGGGGGGEGFLIKEGAEAIEGSSDELFGADALEFIVDPCWKKEEAEAIEGSSAEALEFTVDPCQVYLLRMQDDRRRWNVEVQ